LAVVESIQKSSENGEENLLGFGSNARVYQSVRRAFACYKVLHLDRARQNNLSIVREAVMQYEMGVVAKQVPNGALIPEVLGFVERPDMLAVMMQKVEGNSLIEIIEGKAELPENFDIDSFFSRLEATISHLNEEGYFHRDLIGQRDNKLTPNSGNVMVDKEGNPWLIDFGSAIKSLKPEGDAQRYQLRYGGQLWNATDLTGIREMKNRVASILHHKEQE
jgi:serine/threonine protein kinase